MLLIMSNNTSSYIVLGIQLNIFFLNATYNYQQTTFVATSTKTVLRRTRTARYEFCYAA